jgi:hypothetical protein
MPDARTFPLLALALASLPVAANAYDDAALTRLFPPESQVSGWRVTMPLRLFPGARVFDYMDGAGEVPRSYSLRGLGSTIYSKGAIKLEVAIFEMESPTAAFGYFSIRSFLDRSPTARDVPIPTARTGRLDPAIGVLTFWKGSYTVVIQPQDGKPDPATLRQFGSWIATHIHGVGEPPALLKRLPSLGLIPGTRRYLVGRTAFDSGLEFSPNDVFGAGRGALAVAEEVETAGGSESLAVVQYPAPGAAKAAMEGYRQLLIKRHAKFSPQAKSGMFFAYAQHEKGTAAAVDGSRVLLVLFAQNSKGQDAAMRSVRSALASLVQQR